MLVTEADGAAAGWGILGLVYALPYSIVGLVKENKKRSKAIIHFDELHKLYELKEKGIITEEEFSNKKLKFLK